MKENTIAGMPLLEVTMTEADIEAQADRLRAWMEADPRGAEAAIARAMLADVSPEDIAALHRYGKPDVGPTREELAHEVERLRGLMEQQDRRIIRLTAELNMHARPKGFVNAKKRRRMEARAVRHAIQEVLR